MSSAVFFNVGFSSSSSAWARPKGKSSLLRRGMVAWGKPGLKNPGVMAEIFWFGHVRVYIYIYVYIWLYLIIFDYIWLYLIIFDYIWIYLAIWFFGPCRIWDGNNGKRIRKLEIWSLILERKKKTGEKDESERTSTVEVCRRFRRGPKHRTWLQ